MKDYYDIYLIYQINRDRISTDILKKAVKTVFDNRNLAVRHNDTLDLIEANENIRHLWSNYSMKYSFAEEIKFDDVFTCIRDLCREIGLI